jgi:hypothetical protein
MSSEPDANPARQPAHRSLLPQKATDICTALGVDVLDSPLLHEGMSPEQFVRALVAAEQYNDAIAFMSCALPKRDAVWWACVCAHESEPRPTPVDAAALEAAVRWVKEPSEEHRRAAISVAEATEYATPGGLAAFGAFLSGGSLTPPDIAPVPPADHLTARAVAGAVTLAAVRSEPEKAEEKFRRFLERGLDVAYRRLRWDQPEKKED